MDLLSFGEVDAGDLALDLGVHDDGVVGDDGSDTVEIDRYVVLGDRPGDDRRRRRCRIRRLGISRRPYVFQHKSAAGKDDDHRADENNDVFLPHWCAPVPDIRNQHFAISTMRRGHS
jgi:hypothetical protein